MKKKSAQAKTRNAAIPQSKSENTITNHQGQQPKSVFQTQNNGSNYNNSPKTLLMQQ
jgi:hypothetical protein